MRGFFILAVFGVMVQIAGAGFWLEVDARDSARANLYSDGACGAVWVVSQGGLIDKYPPEPIGIWPVDPSVLPWPWPEVSVYYIDTCEVTVPPQPQTGLIAWFTTMTPNVGVGLYHGDTFEALGSVRIPEPTGLIVLGLGGFLLRRRR